MTPAVATRIAQYARAHLPAKPKSVEAAGLIREWLRAEGMERDRWGNYKRPGKDDERWQFGEKVLREQYRAGDEWKNRDSSSLIDAAYNLIGEAAIVLEDTELSGRVLKATGRRKDVAETQKLRETRKERETLAKQLAMRSIAASHRDAVWRLIDSTLPVDEQRSLDQLREVHYDRFLEQLESGADPADLDEGGAAASVKLPPLLPLGALTEYLWVEQVAGDKYPVYIWRRSHHAVHVDIGWGAAPRIGETPSKLIRSELSVRHGAVPVRLSGAIENHDGKWSAALAVLGTSPGSERSGEPTELWVSRQHTERLLVMLKQLVYLWCTILEGYRIQRFRYTHGIYSELAARALRELAAAGTLIQHEEDDFQTFSWNRIRR